MKSQTLLSLLPAVIAVTAPSSSSALEVAGDLLVDLNASNYSGGTWVNNGTLGGNFTAGTGVSKVSGANAIYFNGTDSYFTGPASPASITGLDRTSTIEAWVFNPHIASEESLVTWGRRGGGDGTNMSFNYGNHGAYGAVGHWGGPDIGWVDSGGAPAAGEWHLLTYSYDGTTTRVYSDGVLQNSEVLGAGVINTHAGFPINVGAQNTGSGIEPSLQLSGYVGQVRVHSDVLSDAQILTNYNQEVGNYVFGGALPGLFGPDDKPVHRWSFDNVAGAAPDGTVVIDSIGGANGLVRGTGALATGTGIDLPGAPNSVGSGGTYIDLPNGLISSKTQVTLEGWVSIDGNTNWARIFDIGSSEGGEITGPGDTNGGGSSGLDYLMLSATNATNFNSQRIEWRNEDPAGGGIATFDSGDTTIFGDRIHFAVSVDNSTPGSSILNYWRDGQHLTVDAVAPFNLSDINDVNTWLGRSNWLADGSLDGTFDEFRIYDVALSDQQVLASYLAGPNVIIPEPSRIVLLLGGFLGLLLLRRRA